MEPPLEKPAEAPPRRKGCLGWGCLILLLVMAVILGCVGLAVWWGVNEARELTEEGPWTLPPLGDAPPAGGAGLERRAETFRNAAPPATLEVTQAELNGLISTDPEFAKSVQVRLEEGKAFFDVSYPLSRLPPPASTLLGDRWFNGTIECAVRLENGRLLIDPTGAVTARDQERVEDWRLQPLRESLIFDQIGGGRLEELARGAESVDLRRGKIVLKK